MNLVVSARSEESKARVVITFACFSFLPCIRAQLGLAVMWSVFTLNGAILTAPKHRTSSATAVAAAAPSSPDEDAAAATSKKDKRGVFGIGPHGYDEWAHNHHHHHAAAPPLLPAPPAPHPQHPVNLGAHFHTTVTKKIGIPIPYPYPVKVSVLHVLHETKINYDRVLM
jgi:hypothetical protein